MPFDTTTNSLEWTSFLENIQKTAKEFNPELIVATKIVMFADKDDKKLWMKAVKHDIAIAYQEGKSTVEEGNLLLASWTNGITVASFQKLLRSSGILGVFTNSLGGVIAQQSQETVSWHTYAVFFQKGILGVYDPSFIPGTENLAACKGITFVKRLLRIMREINFVVSEIWFSGGGNDGTQCQEMTRAWIENEVCVQHCHNLGNWNKSKGWYKMKF